MLWFRQPDAVVANPVPYGYLWLAAAGGMSILVGV